MASVWDKAAERSRLYEVADYERAGYRLFTGQVVSAHDPATRKDYFLIAEEFREYEKVFDPVGVRLRHNTEYRYVVAQPRHVLNQNKASKTATLMVLVLADIYHRVRFKGQEGDQGEAIVELPDLREAFQGMTGFDFPENKGDVRALLAEIERWGVIRLQDSETDPTQPYCVMVHPAISDVVTKEWLTQLEGLRKPVDGSIEDDGEEAGHEEADDVSA